MAFTLPPLPYAMNALEPYLSRETLEYHYGKHHQTYVDNLNKLVADTPLAKHTLEEIIREAKGPLFNNAAQVWNHTFYWHCLTPQRQTSPTPALTKALDKQFGSLDRFKEQFSQTALGTFGSGWAWLVLENGSLSIISTSNAETPLAKGQQALLTCDVWEHAYYIDYRNARAKYLDNFWELVNWPFVSSQFEKS